MTQPPSTTPPQIFSAYAKLGWAQKLFHKVKSTYDAYFLSRPYQFNYHPHPDSGMGGFSITNVQQPPPELMMMMGDVVHNARASLDHLAFALAQLNPNATERQLFGVSFPIEEDKGRFERYVRGRTNLLASDVQERITELQPFNANAPPRTLSSITTRRMLGRLNELDRTDKHRMLNLTFAGSGKLAEPPALPEPYHAERDGVSIGPLAGEGVEFAYWRFNGPVPEQLPDDIDLYEAIPLTLCFSEMMVGAGGAMPLFVYDLINTIFMCVQAAETSVDLFVPCFSGGSPAPIP